MYRVNHSSYCGMRDVPACFDEATDARQYAAQRLRRYRKHFQIATLETGKEWEILEPEDNAAMVPDACGILAIEHVTYECRECGGAHETQADALHCCANYGRDDNE